MRVGFDGRHVVVTGGRGALGSAVSAALAAAGAVCHVPVRGAAPLDPVAGPDAGRIHLVPGVDLTDERAVASFYAGLPELWASVHCAGGFAGAAIVDTSLDLLGRMWSSNTASCYACCREAVRAFRRTGAGGRIVNVAARPALDASAGAGMTAYAASKAAVGALTVALARELLAEGIWVNAVAPSILDTPDNRRAMPGADWSGWPKLDDVAAWIVWLASPANATTSGAVIPAYGRA